MAHQALIEFDVGGALQDAAADHAKKKFDEQFSNDDKKLENGKNQLEEKAKGMSTGAIVAIVILLLVLICCCVGFLYACGCMEDCSMPCGDGDEGGDY